MDHRAARSARDVAIGAVLTAMALIIPLLFRGTLQIYVPPFSATLMSHVPSMMGMFISPLVAAMVGAGSTIGFLVTVGPVIAGRAFIHVIFGVMGALLLRRGWGPWPVFLATLPVHAVGEAVVVRLFGFDPFNAWVVTGLGAAGHHLVDAFITWTLMGLLSRAGLPWFRRPAVGGGA